MLLQRQHIEIEQVLLEALQVADASRRAHLSRCIVDTLELHSLLEEEIFYPALRRSIDSEAGDEGQRQVMEAYVEHGVLLSLLDRVREIDADLEGYRAVLVVLQRRWEEHVGREESFLFPAAQACMDPEQLEALAHRMQKRALELALRRPWDTRTRSSPS